MADDDFLWPLPDDTVLELQHAEPGAGVVMVRGYGDGLPNEQAEVFVDATPESLRAWSKALLEMAEILEGEADHEERQRQRN